MPQTRRISGHARSATAFRISDSLAAPEAERQRPLAPRVPSFLSYRLRQICLGIMDEVLRPADLKPVEYATLTILDDEPGLDQHQLAGRLGIDKMSMSKLADKLELRGLVARQASVGDRRVNEMHLTPVGRKLRRKLQPAALAAQQRILEPLRPGERAVFVDLLSRVIEGHQSYAHPGNGRRSRRQVQASS
jgi:DNA-binding MarR family transcriptional regulator